MGGVTGGTPPQDLIVPEAAFGAGPFARQAWSDLDEPVGMLHRIARPAYLPHLPSPLPLGVLAADSVAIASLAANVVLVQRSLPDRAVTYPEAAQVPVVEVDPVRVRTSFSSERVLRVNDVQPTVWADHSGFFRAADGWVRVHGNYRHHADRVCTLLGVHPAASPHEFRQAIRRVAAEHLEDEAALTGAIVVRVREETEWLQHPQGVAASGSELIVSRRIGGADPRPWPPQGTAPLSGVRVLDLCRVIAGPVGTRMLAQAGADVLRVDTPRLPEPEWQHFDTGQGKRSTLLELQDSSSIEVLNRLLARADVVVTGYRPGALDRFGLAPHDLATRFPGLVIANIAAWDPSGPWGRRRGFDSIVQAASGIAEAHAADAKPGTMPAQVLDHSSGYFLAAAIMSALARQRRTGGTHHVALTLDRVASHLLRSRNLSQSDPEPGNAWTVTGGAAGDVHVQCAQPPSAFAGATDSWPAMARPHGSDAAEWVS